MSLNNVFDADTGKRGKMKCLTPAPLHQLLCWRIPMLAGLATPLFPKQAFATCDVCACVYIAAFLSLCIRRIFRVRKAQIDAHCRTRRLGQVYDAGAVFLLRRTGPRRLAPLRACRAHLHAFHESYSPVCGCVRAQATGRGDWSRAIADIPDGQGKNMKFGRNSWHK